MTLGVSYGPNQGLELAVTVFVLVLNIYIFILLKAFAAEQAERFDLVTSFSCLHWVPNQAFTIYFTNLPILFTNSVRTEILTDIQCDSINMRLRRRS